MNNNTTPKRYNLAYIAVPDDESRPPYEMYQDRLDDEEPMEPLDVSLRGLLEKAAAIVKDAHKDGGRPVRACMFPPQQAMSKAERKAKKAARKAKNAWPAGPAPISELSVAPDGTPWAWVDDVTEPAALTPQQPANFAAKMHDALLRTVGADPAFFKGSAGGLVGGSKALAAVHRRCRLRIEAYDFAVKKGHSNKEAEAFARFVDKIEGARDE